MKPMKSLQANIPITVPMLSSFAPLNNYVSAYLCTCPWVGLQKLSGAGTGSRVTAARSSCLCCSAELCSPSVS